MRRAGLALMCVCMALGACLFPDLDALGERDGSALDASADVARDGSDASDANLATDASVEASPAPCSQPHTFCDDFDQGALGAKWDSITSKVGPLALFDGGLSPPNALLATIMAGAAGQSELDKTTATSDTHFRVALDLRVEAPAKPTGTEIDMVDLTLTPSGFDALDVVVERLGASSVLEVDSFAKDGGATVKNYPFSEDFAAWKHVVLEVDLAAHTATVSVEGVPVASGALPAVSPSPVDLAIGATFEENVTSVWRVYFDNVTYDTIE